MWALLVKGGSVHAMYMYVCILLHGNQILMSKYLDTRSMVVSGGGAMDLDGNEIQSSYTVYVLSYTGGT